MNILIKNTSIVTMDGENKILKNSSIGIEENIIKYIGEIPEEFKADKVIDGKNKLVMPGLINAHTHLAMSLLRNYADDLPLWDWLSKKVWPIEDKFTGEDVYWGSMLSIIEMIKSGVTCFSDMYFFMDDVAKATDESGIRGVLARGLQGSEVTKDDIRFKEARKLYSDWHNKCDGRITTMIAPHAPYTCSPEYLKGTVDLAKELNIGIHIHLSESKKEVDDNFKQYNKSPIKHVYDLGVFDVPVTAAHCVHISEEDIELMAEKGVSVINNPGSNLKLGNGFAPVELMLKKGLNVALGTDGSSSNNNLNMFEEINLAAIVNKAVNGDPTSIPAITAIEMATKNGARALQLGKTVGTIEVGKKADMIIIDLNKPHFYPIYNVVSSLAYSAQASDVETVIVNGKILMENYEIKTMDTEKVIYNVQKSVIRLLK